jgi:predicted AAA+ superfamily ATPase
MSQNKEGVSMLERKAAKHLVFWREHRTKQGLLLTGARQVGKTFLVREFAKEYYRYFVEINLIDDRTAANVLNAAQNADDLFQRISLLAAEPLVPGETLIFIDEVQIAKEIVTAIKFLVERNDYDFILSGSLLGVALKDIRSVPVGYLDTVEMFPLDFEEFCWARGVGKGHLSLVRSAFDERVPVKDYLHDKLARLYEEYLIVGGMPEAVSAFAQTNNIQHVRAIQQSITYLYKQDISKYNAPRALTLKEIYDLIPSELSKQNRRFIINSLDKNARFNRYENDFVWLAEAGVALPAFVVHEPTYPLLLSKSTNLFKLFMSDVGLLTSTFIKDVSLAVLERNPAINYGSIFENMVAQELTAHGYALYYYKDNKKGEVDFVVETPTGDVTLVEVKSGHDYKVHRALRNLLEIKNYQIDNAYVLCESNIVIDGRVTYLPNYLAFCI